MKMESMSSNILPCDDDQRDLEQLLEAFGSMVSLDDIASAYCQAGRNVYTAAEILCNQQGSTSSTSSDASVSLEQSSDNMVENPNYLDSKAIASKAKKCSASMGTVSAVIGREYTKPRPPTKDPRKITNPLKLNSHELSVPEIWGEEIPSNVTVRDETMHKDVEDFLFTMLGDGFGLDMNIIREVVGVCGYDAKKSMEKLLDLSASPLGKSDDELGIAMRNVSVKTKRPMEKSKQIVSARSDRDGLKTRNELESSKKGKDRHELQKEILEALFNVPEKFEEPPKSLAREVRRSRVSGKVVTEPLKDISIERRTVAAKPQTTENENEDNEGSYTVLRKAVKEYWLTMKEYYKAAVDAFAKGDHAKANNFLEEGHFFMKKAQEADDRSTQKLLETRDDEAELPLDLHDHEPKEAIRSLKFHLTSLSGIPSIRYLKIIVAINDEDTKGGGARKRLIMKFLERESIKWTMEDNDQVIVIRLDEINPKRLSFIKKSVTDS